LSADGRLLKQVSEASVQLRDNDTGMINLFPAYLIKGKVLSITAVVSAGE
jgi:hypothetical protein